MSTQIEPTDERTAVDFIEPLTECSHYRAASIYYLDLTRSLLGVVKDGGRDAVAPSLQACLTASDFMLTTLGYLRKCPNVAMGCEVVEVAMGISDGSSEAAIATRYGVTRQAVSLEVRKFAGLVELKPSTAMRSEEAVEAYRERQTGIRPRK